MVYKLFKEEGDYADIETGDHRNLMEAKIVYTPEGINVGWEEFDSIEEAIKQYSIKAVEQIYNIIE